MKYQCNLCGRIHDTRRNAVDCHPDINVLTDEMAENWLRVGQGVVARMMAEIEAEQAKGSKGAT